MKKLLALILCVMMFVSVISTSAFADYNHATQRTWKGENQNKKIVEALRTNLEGIYGSYAVDNAVYKSVKSIDDMMKDMVDEMLKDYAPNVNGTMTSSTALNDAILAGLRRTIGGEITDYIDKHQSDFYKTDSLGHRVFNPAAYAGVFSTAASKALTSGKAVAGIQAYMIYAADRAAFNTISQQAADLENEINAWGHLGDYGWDDMTRTIRTWHTPGGDVDSAGNLDGVLHGIRDSYASVLSVLGQLGVDLNDDGLFGLGFGGWVRTADGTWAPSSASDDEAVNTALLRRFFSDVNNDKKIDIDGADAEYTGIIYENRTGTYYVDKTGDGIVDSLDDGTHADTFGLQYRDKNAVDNATPYFITTGTDWLTINPFNAPVEANVEVATDGANLYALNPDLGSTDRVVTYAIP